MKHIIPGNFDPTIIVQTPTEIWPHIEENALVF